MPGRFVLLAGGLLVGLWMRSHYGDLEAFCSVAGNLTIESRGNCELYGMLLSLGTIIAVLCGLGLLAAIVDSVTGSPAQPVAAIQTDGPSVLNRVVGAPQVAHADAAPAAQAEASRRCVVGTCTAFRVPTPARICSECTNSTQVF